MRRAWIVYTGLVVVLWGCWGAWSALPAERYGYPDSLIYSVWAVTMIVPCAGSMWFDAFQRGRKGVGYGLLIGLTGAGGQLLLFASLTMGPAFLIFPIIALSPAVTVLLATCFLGERTTASGWVGVMLALVAIVIFALNDGTGKVAGIGWLPLAIVVCFCWGVQAFLMKCASVAGINDTTVFFWMTVSALLLIPVALLVGRPTLGPHLVHATALTAGIQLLNAVGALFLVMAFRHGRAIVVSPAANSLAPVVTVVLSLAMYAVMPSLVTALGIASAIVGSTLLIRSDVCASVGTAK